MMSVWLPLLLAGMMFGMAFFDSGRTDDADEAGGDGDGTDETPQDGTLRLGLEARGDVTVPETVNRIEISAQTGSDLIPPESPFWVNWNTDDITPALSVTGSDAAETFILSGSGYSVDTGGGADRVEIGAASNISVVANAGDSVFGPDANDIDNLPWWEARIHVALTGGATWVAGSAGLEVGASGGNNQLTGGAGNDKLISYGGDTLSGGAGDDELWAVATDWNFSATQNDFLGDWISYAPSVLDGGPGNDTLYASFNDTLTGGDGADAMTLFFQTARPDEDLGALVTDFTAGEDTLLIYYNGQTSEDDEYPIALRDDITVTETDEGTRILGRNGETIVELAGVTDLRIGVATELAGSSFTDLAGAPVERADLDVIIRVYEETMT